MKIVRFIFRLALFVFLIWFAYQAYLFRPNQDNLNYGSIQKMKHNYASEIDYICTQRRLPAAYFKALVVLESSGNKPAGTRFEPHIYQKLKKRAGRLRRKVWQL